MADIEEGLVQKLKKIKRNKKLWWVNKSFIIFECFSKDSENYFCCFIVMVKIF